jgi:hypothetical protein
MKPMFFTELKSVSLEVNMLLVHLPVSIVDAVANKLQVEEPEKYKLTFSIEKKKKPRTTGPKSQQAHLHGHLQQIADYCGYYMSEIKEAMKEDISDWPRKIIDVGDTRRTIYMSEADADTVLESKAIEWTHVKASELGIILYEGE